MSDLQNFVNVALATAAGGEDDLAYDRLSSLRTVASGFSSLIYRLKPDTGSHELRESCSSVWKAYKRDRNLPEMLVGHYSSYRVYVSAFLLDFLQQGSGVVQVSKGDTGIGGEDFIWSDE